MSRNSAPQRRQDGSLQRIGRVELLVSHILRGGVTLSFFIVLLGTVLTFYQHPEYFSSRDAMEKIIAGQKDMPHGVGDVVGSAEQWHGRGWVLLGLLVLILTPVFRVAVALGAFWVEKDRPFILFSSIVLILLLTSFFLGHATT